MIMDESKKFGKLALFDPIGVRKQYGRKSTILFQGEVPAQVMLLRNGLVKVYGITGDGDQRTITILTAGDVFPTSWVFGKSPACIYYYEAMTDCTVVGVSKRDYETMVNQHAELKDQIYQTYRSHYVAATMHVYALEHSYAQDKIIYILQYLTTRFGEKQDDGTSVIRLRLSHHDIADMVGITRETAAVELHKLKEKGIVKYQKFAYSVDTSRLFCSDRGDEFEDIALTS